MNFDDFWGVFFLALAVVCYGIYRYCRANVYLKYKDQKVVVK